MAAAEPPAGDNQARISLRFAAVIDGVVAGFADRQQQVIRVHLFPGLKARKVGDLTAHVSDLFRQGRDFQIKSVLHDNK